ncbi:MAG: helix-turn-helix transcriptional regulator [Sphingomonadales bacterium]|nr:helix-turn-helix transcriptional regulator [Sphingomonadales bacterium]
MDDIIEQTVALNALTDKQREVLALVSEGMTSKEIARKLGISESAVNQRIEVIRQRLGGMPRSQIARLYRRTSTVVLTIPTSNSVTGKSIHLQHDGAEAQQAEPEGAGVSTTPLLAMNPIGSQPSNLFFGIDSALGGPNRLWYRLGCTVLLIMGVLACAVLGLTVAISLVQLRHVLGG